MPVYNRSQVKSSSIAPLPRNRYTLRIKKASHELSKASGNPMIKAECEIVRPLELEIDGTTYQLDAFDVFYFFMLTDEGIGNAVEAMERMGISCDTIDTDNPAAQTAEMNKGLVFDAILSSRPKRTMVADPNKKGALIPLKDENGKEILQGYEVSAQVTDIQGKATVEVNKPY